MPPTDETTQNTPPPDSSPTQASDTPETAPEAQNEPTDTSIPESQNTPIQPEDPGTNEPQNPPETTTNQDSPTSEQPTAQTPVIEPIQTQASLSRQLLILARNAIQFRKRKKLDKIMTLFVNKSKITNDEVEKFLHVSDATATRYLSILEKENKIKQVGKTGKGVSYSRI